ncbi:hypothetical protein PILCRDRAFT_96452 [Piloderma croceum F 1598]|uniref:FAM192A/Fyv6 N-terminal domain-containing protein n=1 Tax=Piloderma croceum (strain F 1598) TaxID=765440 RepID=A0A0C3C6P9_PILCF|nr:hypothetical protein PILCRDRAFT_96452 [Piloderma croceum F 1598]
MDDSIPSISTGSVGSRFVSSNDIETAKARRDEQWKAAYARLGQEPPPQPVEDSFDGRSLAEKLAANKVAKQEEWEEKTKLANQFRALEEDEIMFLDSIRERQEEEERQRKEKDGVEVMDFKKAVAARENATNNPPPLISSTPKPTNPPSDSTKGKTVPAKKDIKKSLKGVMVKKKPKAAAALTAPATKEKRSADGESKAESDSQPEAKRRRVEPDS